MTNSDIVAAAELRNKIYQFEEAAHQQPQIDIPVLHHFSFKRHLSWGIYGREICIPAGAIVTGKLHKYPQLNILLTGTMELATENGLLRLEAPYIVSSPSGTKRIARALTECRWLTILPTVEADPAEIERQFIASDEADYQRFLAERGAEWPGLPQQS